MMKTSKNGIVGKKIKSSKNWKKNIRKLLKKDNRKLFLRDLWSLDYTIAKFTLPRLKAFKENTVTYASSAGFTPETWDIALDKMIWSMEYIIQDGENYDKHPSKTSMNYNLYKTNQITKEEWIQLQEEDDAKTEEGLILFGKYFRALWY